MSNIAPTRVSAHPSRPTLPTAKLAAESFPAASAPSSSDHQVTEIKDIITSFKHLLAEHPDSSAGVGIKREIFVLERWLSSFRRGLISASKLAANGPAWLNLHRGKLVHASEEALHPEPSRNGTSLSDPMQLTLDAKDKPYVGVMQNIPAHEATSQALNLN
ncbi:MAG: hypothetical protein KBA75_00540 [Alphaproteobacteria bacterium]|nr:hypothetical protein [Alphaproteobacteria bacterium]